VAIDPGVFRGLLPLPASVLRGVGPFPANPRTRRRAITRWRRRRQYRARICHYQRRGYAIA